MSDYIGIDYSLGDGSNVDPATGIHYGVIPANDCMAEAVWESFEADYGDPHCPECGNEAVAFDGDKHGEWETLHTWSCSDYACEGCEHVFGSDEAFGDEPVGHTLDSDGYQAFIDSDNDIMVCKSPYFTYAQYCSPCAPGAGHLRNPREPDSGAPKTYCLGHDWFDDGVAPYTVYDVATGQVVEPEAQN